MTTLLLSENLPPRIGGSGQWLWDVYSRWPRGEVVVAAGEHPEAGPFDEAAPMAITRMPLTFPSWGVLGVAHLRRYLSAAGRVRSLVRGYGVERIHAGRCLPEGLLAWTLRMGMGLPYVCYVHGEELNTCAGSRELAFWARRVLAGAARLVVNSRRTGRLLEKDWGVACDRIALLHPSVDVGRFVPAERSEAERTRLGWQGRRVVLTVGRLEPRKGHDRMIEAVARLRSRFPDLLYAIVGDGPARLRLQGMVREHGLARQVLFHGAARGEAVVRCLQQCDLFVLPNRAIQGDEEGFGICLAEAQACGRPVVAGISGGTGDAVADGRTGRLVDAASVEALSAAVSHLLEDGYLRRAMGEAARAWAVEQFDADKQARRARALLGLADAHETHVAAPLRQAA